LLRTFTVPRIDVYENPVGGAQDQVVLASGETGTLFLSRAGWEATSDGYKIHGNEWAVFKAPNCAAAAGRLLTRLAVIPEQITMRGHLEGKRSFFDLELLGDEAGQSQIINWNGAGYVKVRLSDDGARRLRLGQTATTAKVWPVRICVKGSPAVDRAVTGEVDVLNIELADRKQDLEYKTPGSPINLVLTQDGVSAFHVTPAFVAEFSGESPRAAAPCVDCAKTGRDHARKRVSRAARRRVPA
jgi:hypothetical protein